MKSAITPELDPTLNVEVVNDFYHVGHRPVPYPVNSAVKLTPFKGVGPAYDYTTLWTQLLFTEHVPADVRRARSSRQERPTDVPVTKIK